MLLTADSTEHLHFLCLLPGFYLDCCISDTDISYSKQKSGSFVPARCLPSITSSFTLLSVCFHPSCNFFFFPREQDGMEYQVLCFCVELFLKLNQGIVSFWMLYPAESKQVLMLSFCCICNICKLKQLQYIT